MKKSIFAALIISSFAYSHAAGSCLDFSTNLSRGSESSLVLSVQNFLFAKGFLKVAPNGYFGPSTFAAVKAYQKAQGFAQVGNTGPATRAAIKRDSCTQSQTVTQATQAAATTTPIVQISTSTTSIPAQNLPRPAITSFDLVTLFAGGAANWNFSMYGTNFSTSSNVITMRNTETRKTYTIGTLSSATGTSVLMPTNLTGTEYACGNGCKEKLEAGRYEVVVTTAGGSSDAKMLSVVPFTMSAQTTAVNTIPASINGIQLATFSFSSPQAIVVRDVYFTLGTSTISGGGINTITLKDEVSGNSLDGDAELYAVQSGIVGVYANVSNTKYGNAEGTFSVTIEDYIGKHDTSFTSKSIMVTVAGVI
jgi:peptidoglycan hydrolase-like protein with peptidoglycan-binding domain